MENIKKYEENEKVILLNPNSGNWIRLSKRKFDSYQSNPKKFNTLLEQYGVLNANKRKNEVDIKSIYFAVTRKCNLCCDFCTMNSGPLVSTEDDLTISEIEGLLLPQIINLNPNKIVITGGEPLVRKDIISILKLFASKFEKRRIILQTNGLLIKDTMITELANYIGVIEISIENIFDDSRMLDRMREIFKAIKQCDIVLSLSFVVDDKSEKYLKSAIDLCANYDAALTIRIVSPLGRAKEKNIDDQIRKEKNILNSYLRVLDYIIEKQYYDTYVAKTFISVPQAVKTCGAFGKVLSIRQDGEIYMCSNFKYSRYCLGNIRAISMKALLVNLQTNLDDSSYQNEFFASNKELCRACEIAGFCPGPCAAVVAENGECMEDCMFKKALIKFNLFYYNAQETFEYNIRAFRNYLKQILRTMEIES